MSRIAHSFATRSGRCSTNPLDDRSWTTHASGACGCQCVDNAGRKHRRPKSQEGPPKHVSNPFGLAELRFVPTSVPPALADATEPDSGGPGGPGSRCSHRGEICEAEPGQIRGRLPASKFGLVFPPLRVDSTRILLRVGPQHVPKPSLMIAASGADPPRHTRARHTQHRTAAP